MSTTISQTQRIRLDIAYSGEAFHGWAAQPGLRTVEGELTAALQRITREELELTVAGRTDAGVHASGQVAHFDLSQTAWLALPGRSTRTPELALAQKVNAVLSHSAGSIRGFTDVVVREVTAVSQEFDARFSALWRRYHYRIADSVKLWDPLRKDVLWLSEELDLAAMNRAAQTLLGEHDFLSYCKPRPGASTVRTLQELQFARDAQGIIMAVVKADAFCHSQVRTLMGTLIEVGRGAKDESWPGRRLEERNRDGQVIVAPAHPLTLAEVGYPEAGEYAAQAKRARTYRGTECG